MSTAMQTLEASTTITLAPVFDRDGVARLPNTTLKGKPALRFPRKCGRCGGAGRSDKWVRTGSVCYDCGGAGTRGVKTVPLYTRDQLDKLNARRDVARGKASAKRQAAADARAAEAKAQADEFAKAFPDVVAYLAKQYDEDGFISGDGFNADLARKLDRYGSLSQGQVDAIRKNIAREEAEAARKAAATHVGTIGERITANVTVVWAETFPGDFGSYTVAIMRTDDGRTLKTKGQFWKAAGWTGAIKATVKAHEHYKGEPVTIVQRIKSV